MKLSLANQAVRQTRTFAYSLLIACWVALGAQAAPAVSADKIQPALIGASISTSIALTDIEKRSQALSKTLAGKPAVLVFYRGGWCPYCNVQLSDLRKLVNPAKELGFQLIAVSPDQASELFKSVKKNELDYLLLSDAKAELIDAFGIGFTVDAMTREKYAGYGIDLEKASGQKHYVLPVPSVFVLDGSGKIQFQYVNPDYSVRLSSKVIIAALEDIASRKKKAP
jgi:peroxiredoxin